MGLAIRMLLVGTAMIGCARHEEPAHGSIKDTHPGAEPPRAGRQLRAATPRREAGSSQASLARTPEGNGKSAAQAASNSKSGASVQETATANVSAPAAATAAAEQSIAAPQAAAAVLEHLPLDPAHLGFTP